MSKINIFIISVLFSILAFLPWVVKADGASFFLLPEEGIFGEREIFSVDLKIDTGGMPINAAEAILYFPKDILQIINVSKENSIFSLWPKEPTFSNFTGEILFSGGMPHPGFDGKDGQIITIKFEAIKEGEIEFSFGESKILADDGKGTDIFSVAKGASFEIKPTAPGISSLTHPDQNKWYSNKSPELSWELGPEITEVSFVLDKNQKTFPDEISEDRINSKIYPTLEDGVWYFHLRAKKEQEWTFPSHFKIQIDTQPPLPFEIIVDNEGDSTNPQPWLYFETEDNPSGVEYYLVKIDEEEELLEKNPYQTPILIPGIHRVAVTAFDRAENSRGSNAQIEINPIEKPNLSVFPEKYIAGEEVLYVEGTALPEVEISIFLEKNGQKIKEWKTLSNLEGEWSFSTKDLFKSGIYQITLKAKDKRGAVSELTQPKTIEIVFSGLALGPILITFRNLVLVFALIAVLGILILGFLIFRIRQSKRILRKETKEAEESVVIAFNELKKEIAKQIEMLDSQPGFTEKEKKVCEDLKKTLKDSEEIINKEIRDIERELK